MARRPSPGAPPAPTGRGVIHPPYFQDHLLPVIVLVLGAGLAVRFAHWVGLRRRRWVDVQIRRQIESGAVASESLKRSRAISEAVEWSVVALTYFIVAILSFDRLSIPLTTLGGPATVIAN